MKNVNRLVIILFIIVIVAVSIYSYSNLISSDYLMNVNITDQPNLALGKSVEVNTGIFPSHLIDKNPNNFYKAFKKQDIIIDIDLGSLHEIDSLVLKEIGLNVQDFEIHLFTEEERWEKVYHQDKIELYRLATFSPKKASKVRILVNESQDAPTIRSIEVYNMGLIEEKPFRKTAYISVGHLYDALMNESLSEDEIKKMFHSQYYDLYTDVFFIFDIKWNEFAEITYGEGVENFSNMMTLFRDMLGNRDVNVFVTILNPHDNAVVYDTITRQKDKLIDSMIAFANEYELDGIDLDWEFPFTQEEFDAYNLFLRELKQRMVTEIKPDAQLSLALATWALRYKEETIDVIDQVQVMGYDILDQDGQHSSFYGAAIQPVQYLLDQGFNKEQLNIGVPFYGTYLEGRMEQYLYKYLDEVDYSRNSYDIQDRGEVYFNSAQLIKDKTAYALYGGYGGVMVFSLYCDIEMDESNSLSKAIKDIVDERMEVESDD